MIKIEIAENGWIITDHVGNQSVYTDPVAYINRIALITMRHEVSKSITVTRDLKEAQP